VLEALWEHLPVHQYLLIKWLAVGSRLKQGTDVINTGQRRAILSSSIEMAPTHLLKGSRDA
jgi:hypothetical protein